MGNSEQSIWFTCHFTVMTTTRDSQVSMRHLVLMSSHTAAATEALHSGFQLKQCVTKARATLRIEGQLLTLIHMSLELLCLIPAVSRFPKLTLWSTTTVTGRRPSHSLVSNKFELT